MKTLAALALLLAAASASAATGPAAPVSAAAGTLSLSCTTPGDALGGLVLSIKGKTAQLTESGMDGLTTRYTLGSGGFNEDGAAALLAGRGGTLFYRTKKSTEFGGAVSEAGLITLTGKPAAGQKRSGYFSRRGTVYLLQCQN